MQDVRVTEAADADYSDGPDKLFGVFQSIGEDLGFDPFYLRAAFLAGLFFSPVAMIAGYAALGGVVALAHWLFPVPRPEAQAAVEPAKPQIAKTAAQQSEQELVAA